MLAEFHYAECRYAEFRGFIDTIVKIFSNCRYLLSITTLNIMAFSIKGEFTMLSIHHSKNK
jgi:hypothetical protein